jgi:hypothetical protein
LRSDLNGNLRHVHLDHAFANIDAARTATWARTQRSRTAILLREGPTWAEYRIGESDRLFFAVHRLDFAGEMEDDTGGKFIVLNLVEGERCDILTGSNEPVELRFAESIVIPAAVGRYTLCNTGGAPCKAVKAFVKG